MPHWMEAMASEVPEEEMGELKIILRYVGLLVALVSFMGFSVVRHTYS